MKQKELVVAGIMSGTSADGIDVALVRIGPGRSSKQNVRMKLIAHEGYSYTSSLRRAVLESMNARSTSTAELARLNWRLGIAYAEAVKSTLQAHRVEIDLIGCHGQTLYHQAATRTYLGRKFSCTWQAGEMAALAGEIGVPVISNFRPADMVAGGQGAPLVPLLDYVLFADSECGRVLQNIGGIANLTSIPAGSSPADVSAFDTGPGNMVIDALAQQLLGRPYDRNGAAAANGVVLEPVLRAALKEKYFRQKPPRTAGREDFGREYAKQFLATCRKYSRKNEDALATGTALTAESIAASYRQFIMANMRNSPVDYIVSGGGARNATLMRMLKRRLEPLGCKVASSDGFGLPSEAKEATAFALLAWQTWHRLPGNVPAATGASRPMILGQVTYV